MQNVSACGDRIRHHTRMSRSHLGELLCRSDTIDSSARAPALNSAAHRRDRDRITSGVENVDESKGHQVSIHPIPATTCPMAECGVELGEDQNGEQWKEHMKSHAKTAKQRYREPSLYCICGESFPYTTRLQRHHGDVPKDGHGPRLALLTLQEIRAQMGVTAVPVEARRRGYDHANGGAER